MQRLMPRRSRGDDDKPHRCPFIGCEKRFFHTPSLYRHTKSCLFKPVTKDIGMEDQSGLSHSFNVDIHGDLQLSNIAASQVEIANQPDLDTVNMDLNFKENVDGNEH